ncbi:glycosyltransferase, partial [Pseudoalteromonas marina]|uniref:glycosyltransferase n=1 Tax=Pseudoalteromonas marina TaxID=267375 RepID=UPI003C38709C
HKYQYRSNSMFKVLMIASLKDYKGVKEFFAIARALLAEKPIQFTVVLNAEPQEIAAYVKTVKLPLNVKLVPRQKNVIPFYQQANLVLNLSRVDEWVETFGLTIIEAMSFGIPVIVPPVGGPTEIVANNKEGYLIASYNIIEIADKIRMLSNNESKCMALSKSARERALFFNEANFNKTILNILNA